MSLFHDLMVFDFNTTCKMLGYDPTLFPQNIKPLDPTNNPAGKSKPSDNLAFYLVMFDDTDINRQIDDITDQNADPTLVTKKYQYVRNVRFIWQTYGDDGMEWADTIRFKLFMQDIQNMFAKQNMSLITDVPEPVYVPELIGQQWYKRYDLAATFNQLVEVDSALPAISGTEIYVETDKGVVGKCSVSPQ